MSIASFSLPVDIPWRRIAFSQDMIDPKACDRTLPPRWRSSIAVFEYQPPDDQQRTDDYLVSYLKVSCTITGFQEDGKEIRIRDRLGRSGWTNQDLTNQLNDLASKYYPCQGAILEVVVAPPEGETQYSFAQYPYFADFDPKKRELYEVVTDTGESMSRSLEDMNVRLGQTTLQSHEVLDKTTLGAGLSLGSGGNSVSGSASTESGTTDLSQAGTENIRTVDGAREARETFSHTTQISQMYHQLDSYHLGSNRAAFYILPRPHTVQSPYTFVNGPREIEGIQEFMLVVVRPKAMGHFCVEAYLETAHLTGKPVADYDNTDTQLHLKVVAPDGQIKHDSLSSTAMAGYIIDRSKGPQSPPLGGKSHGDYGGFEITSLILNEIPSNLEPNLSFQGYLMSVSNTQVTASGWVEGLSARGDYPNSAGTLALDATVYLKKPTPTFVSQDAGLMITGRSVCSCAHSFLVTDTVDTGLYLVYESALGLPAPGGSGGMLITEANKLGKRIQNELLTSQSSMNRYPRNTVHFLDSQLFSEPLAAHIQHANDRINPSIAFIAGVDKSISDKISAVDASTTRADLLRMPISLQVDRFKLAPEEAVSLRKSLNGLNVSQDSAPVPSPVAKVPLLVGLQTLAAMVLLSISHLKLGTQTMVDSPLPQGSILTQHPLGDSLVDEGTVVTVRIASGLSVRIPNLVGNGLTTALCSLRNAGLTSEPTIEGAITSKATVSEILPATGSLITPGTAIVIRLSSEDLPIH